MGVHSTVVTVTPVGEVAGVGDLCVHHRAVGVRDRRTCRATTTPKNMTRLVNNLLLSAL